MWTEDARSDFVLVVAAVVLGGLLLDFVARIPGYPSGGIVGLALLTAWVAAVTAWPPVALTRYRDLGVAGYGLSRDRGEVASGLVVAAPLLVVGVVRGALDGGTLQTLLGRGAEYALRLPEGQQVTAIPVSVLLVVVVAVSSILCFGALTHRSRDAFRGPEMPVREALRTYGMIGAGAGLLLGLLAAAAGSVSALGALLDALAVAGTVLAADRLVDARDRAPRWALVAPPIVAAVLCVFSLGGFLFNPNLLPGLHRGALAFSLVTAFAALLETRRAAWAAVPLALVAAWAPTCAFLPVGILAPLQVVTC